MDLTRTDDIGSKPCSRPGRVRRIGVAGMLAATALIAAPSAVQAVAPCTGLPAVYPLRSVVPGLIGRGWTVVKGDTPVSFRVKVLGVIPDGIATGLDFILVKTSGIVIQHTGGIAAGFSGSPVYIDGQLLGAVSYGFFGADHTIGGVTPARPMVDLFGYPTATPTMKTRVHLTDGARRAAAHVAGVPAATFPTDAQQLPLPLSVSGLSAARIAPLQEQLDLLGLPGVAYRAGSAPLPASGSPTPLAPGDAIAGVVSYGDLTFAGIGTATATCGSYVVAFGHPFFFEGASSLGMNGATVLATVKDTSNLYGGFKIANLTEAHGTIDQDRYAGIRGVEGPIPATAAVVSHVQGLDLGTHRHGESDVVLPSYLPTVSAFHTLSNLDRVNDRIGDGSTQLTWTIEGTAPDGAPFTFTRRNRYFSNYDATIVSIFELYDNVRRIQESRFGTATISSVDVTGSVTQEHQVGVIGRVLTASPLQPKFKKRSRIQVAPGDTILARVHLKLPDGTSRRVDMEIAVDPNTVDAGRLTFEGGRYGRRVKAASFQGLLDAIASQAHNSDLVASLDVEVQADGQVNETTTETLAPQGDVFIQGSNDIRVQVVT